MIVHERLAQHKEERRGREAKADRLRCNQGEEKKDCKERQTTLVRMQKAQRAQPWYALRANHGHTKAQLREVETTTAERDQEVEQIEGVER